MAIPDKRQIARESCMNGRLIHPTTCAWKAAKSRCLACEAPNLKMTREHFWPKWLIGYAGAEDSKFPWPGGRISPLSATIPLCHTCNSRLGSELEEPVRKTFMKLESGGGISQRDAELLIRWLWKFEGYSWLLNDKMRTYSNIGTLRDRVLGPLGSLRSAVCIAVSLIGEIDPSYDAAPIGIDSENEFNCVFVAGVFSKIALVVLLSRFAAVVPDCYSTFHFDPNPSEDAESASLFHPKVGFSNDTDAVNVSRFLSSKLGPLHDLYARSVSGKL